ncbi:MAG TPA: M20/M25/M40 family metallo-hydrolase [Rhizomicrobium sp.]|jgi:acetylornithine deacetylase/succinyl-diaminopimelate desuccinylase-like protein
MKHLAAGLVLLMATPAFGADLRQQVSDYRAGHEAQIVGQLDELTRLHSVAAEPQGLATAAARLEGLLKARGFDTASWSTAGSPPVIYGFLKSPGATRTAVFYAHYDGQPVTPSQWMSDPFAPVMRDGAAGADVDWKAAKPPFSPEWRFFGRATADDKSSITAFLAAFDALKALNRKPSVNIKIVWEGEEESNSVHLAAILKEHAAELQADVWLIGDGPVHQSRAPTLYFGARGGLGLEATVYGPLRALHDGHYGNWAPNPAMMAAKLITQLRDDDGRILIPGFLDDVRPLSTAEEAAIARLPPVEDKLKQEFGIGRSEGNEGLTASTMRPALNIRGIRSGQVGVEAANAIPVDATVSVDFRLVPGQTPGQVRAKLETFLESKGWMVVSAPPDLAMRMAHPRIIRLAWGAGYPALRSNMTSPAAKGVIAAAEKAAGQPVTILPMMGASVPIYLFDDLFHEPVIGLPITNHDNNQHAANENLRLKNLWDAVNLYAAMMAELNW